MCTRKKKEYNSHHIEFLLIIFLLLRNCYCHKFHSHIFCIKEQKKVVQKLCSSYYFEKSKKKVMKEFLFS